MTRTDDLLIGLLGLGWLVALQRRPLPGLSRTARGLIAQNTRLIEANESLRWQNGSLLAELGHRKRAEPVAREPVAREPDHVIDLTAEPGEVPRRDDAESS